ncbi:hypothetical protein ACS127_12960 [Amphibacillus sp. Q70]|uniref:hypothetical protein n=1 Tax=Amphibacillus sp. Q70 TaxID=3453416 RepID=UPI003F86788E
MDDYKKYELECEKIRKQNNQLLDEFSHWLKEKKLSEKTIRKHTDNVDFYINQFLLYYDPIEAKDGSLNVGEFLGYWFIKKAMWSSVSQIKENAASLKKFYTFMNEKGHVDQETLAELKTEIKDEMPEWLETMKRYDDPSIEDMDEV